MGASRGNLCRYIFAGIPLVINNILMMGVIGAVTRAIEINSVIAYRNALIAVVIMIIVVSANRYIAGRLRIAFSIEYVHSLRETFFDGILWLPYSLFAKKSKDRYLSLFVNDINTIDSRYFSGLSNLSYWSVYIFFALIALFFIDPILLIGIIPAEIIIVCGSLFLIRKINKLEIELSNANGDYTTFVSNLFDGIEIAKLAKREKHFCEATGQEISKLEKIKGRYGLFKMFITVGLSSISMCISLLIILYLCAGIAEGKTVATALLAYQISSTLCYAANYCATAILSLKSSAALKTHIENEYFVDVNKIKHEENVSSSSNEKQVCPIVVRNLSFSFNSDEVFTNTSFGLQRGKKYLLVGPSGCGKTTLLNLLSGIYSEYAGTIDINGVELRKVEHRNYLNRISIVHQDTFLFSDTVRNNLSLFSSKVDDNRIDQALITCRLDAVVSALPYKLDTVLENNGSCLSGGEKQRFSIARAILKNCSLLLADEPTASLDEETAVSVEMALLDLPCTAVVVSHRIHRELIHKYDYILQVCNKSVIAIPSCNYLAEV